jgi:hypothetical protein
LSWSASTAPSRASVIRCAVSSSLACPITDINSTFRAPAAAAARQDGPDGGVDLLDLAPWARLNLRADLNQRDQKRLGDGVGNKPDGQERRAPRVCVPASRIAPCSS